ncbi:Ferric reduction oxidase 2 (AtFRO2) (Ferric-chelate reductase 2) (Protein FERRIC CHELATE REDUCTASE DEFECTIVE 1) [Durusdinium trenchii]|uniref:Ferric reduction oxidase 2 (AtFRO2) (Ferric-chelate reductase 2) (Protein FERRIC CHELATE REDUCTASE DEFECTIVE 1) n=1 Tax=Durusdinium trenchii TaxID=1381693 RepID=A0ABP0S7L9_9DINO
MKLAHGLCGTILAALWLALVISYVAAPCKLIEEHMYTMALFACQSLDSFPTELPTLTLVFFLVLCLVLVPGTVVQVSAVRWNVMLHSVGVATLAACILKVCLLYGESRSLLKDSLVFTGIVTGRAAAMYLGMLLLAISRRSIISDRWNLDYPNMIAFHRPVGWWVLWMSLLHSLAFGFYYLCRGGWRELLEACLPVAVRCDGSDHCWNTLGLVNGFGVVATAATIILAVSSQKVIRRRFYNLFYFTHLVTSFVFMLFCGLHDFAMVILMFPGLVFYVRDRFSGLVSLRGSTEVTINILCRSETSSLVMFSWYPAEGNRGSHLLPGTRWVYCRQKTISGLEWHPYSTIFHGNRAFILLKAAGDWSTSLCNSATRDTLRLDIEGPYGKSSDSSGRLGSGDQVRTLLIAGGVGISPFIDLLAGPIDSRRIKLVWAVRGDEYQALAAAIDLLSSFARELRSASSSHRSLFLTMFPPWRRRSDRASVVKKHQKQLGLSRFLCYLL